MNSDEVRLTPRYAPRIRPTPIPASGVFDSPTVCVAINASWVSHILGTLETMDQPDTWVGSPEEIEQARQMVNVLMLALREGNCEEVAFDVRQKPGEPCTLQKTRDGVVWEDFANLLLCVPQSKPPIAEFEDVRVGPVSGVPEVSLDGGTTWTPVPETPGWFPARSPSPGVSQEDQICAAATRAAANLSELYKATYGAVTAGIFNTINAQTAFLSKVNNLLAGIAFGTYYEIIKGVGLGNDYEPEQYAAPSLTSDATQKLMCLLREHGSVGAYQVVSFDFNAVRDNVISEIGINPGTAIWTHLNYLGEEGLNRYGDAGFGDTYDCEVCDEPEPTSYEPVLYAGQGSNLINLGGNRYRMSSAHYTGNQKLAWYYRDKVTLQTLACGRVYDFKVVSGPYTPASFTGFGLGMQNCGCGGFGGSGASELSASNRTVFPWPKHTQVNRIGDMSQAYTVEILLGPCTYP